MDLTLSSVTFGVQAVSRGFRPAAFSSGKIGQIHKNTS